jgi:hypothetical protein
MRGQLLGSKQTGPTTPGDSIELAKVLRLGELTMMPCQPPRSAVSPGEETALES